MHLKDRLHWVSLGLLALSILLAGVASALAETSEDSAGVNTPTLDEQIAGEASSPINAFGGTPQKPEVKDLYKTIYKSLKVDTERAALRTTAAQFEYSETEMFGILQGNLSLLQRTQAQNSTMTTQKLLALLDDIQATYNREAANESLKQTLFLDTYPQEIFVNGDTSDSGFDVVYDLEIIELLLFGDESTSSSEGGSAGENPSFPVVPGGEDGGPIVSGSGPLPGPLPGPTSGGPASLLESLSDGSTASSPSSPSSPSPPSPPSPPSESSPTSPAGDDSPLASEGSPSPEIGFVPSDTGHGLNPAACTANSNLQHIFRDAIAADEEPAFVPETSELPSTETSAPTPTETPPSPESTTSPDIDSEDSADGPVAPSGDSRYKPSYIKEGPDGRPKVESDLTPKTSSTWADAPEVCDKIFCLKVRFTNRPDPAYEETKNCIQCHVQYIVQTLRDTTAQSLTPGKVSGNLLEPATCKKSLFSGGVSLNFIPIAMPIKTPPASELVTGVDLRENFEDFIGNLWGIKIPESSDPSLSDLLVKALAEDIQLQKEILYQNTITTPGTDQARVFSAALAAYDAKVADIDQKIRDSYTAAQFNVSTDLFQALRYEMDQMTFYFESFRAVIEMAQEVTEERKNNLTSAS